MITAALRDGWHVMVFDEHDGWWTEASSFDITQKLILTATQSADIISIYIAPEACGEHVYMQEVTVAVRDGVIIIINVNGQLLEAWWETYMDTNSPDIALLLPVSQLQN